MFTPSRLKYLMPLKISVKLKFPSQFQLGRLERLCTHYIEASITTENVLVALECAEELGLEFIKVSHQILYIYSRGQKLKTTILSTRFLGVTK